MSFLNLHVTQRESVLVVSGDRDNLKFSVSFPAVQLTGTIYWRMTGVVLFQFGELPSCCTSELGSSASPQAPSALTPH
jgi:hypothetical protein